MTLAFKTKLPATQKLVLLALCDAANDQGECYPSVPALQDKCSLSDRAIQKSINELEAGGYLSRSERLGRSTLYQMTPERGSPQNDVHPERRSPTPERGSPPPPNVVHPTPERGSGRTIKEPSVEPSLKQIAGKAQAPAPVPPADFDGVNAEAIKPKALVRLAASWELPEAWGIDAEELGWKPESVLLEAAKFRQYWTVGKGAGQRRTLKGWRQSWSNWLGNAARYQR